jgi:predicted enzyme related to lactoylglutathione lyase
MTQQNSIHWFEIPATDMTRAVRFYESMLGVTLRNEDAGPRKMAIIPTRDNQGVTGCVVSASERSQPSDKGTLIYLGAGGELDACVARAQKAGGEVVVGKTSIGPNGFYALIRDTEGNTVGLHDEAK